MDVIKEKRLVELYQMLVEDLDRQCRFGICYAINNIRSNHSTVSLVEEVLLTLHFRKVVSCTYFENTTYYFKPGEAAPRIAFIQQIIADLKAEIKKENKVS